MAAAAFFIGGAYDLFYGATYSGGQMGYLGATEDGFTLEWTKLVENVRADHMGDTVVDQIFQGMDVFADATLITTGAFFDGSNATLASQNLHSGLAWPYVTTQVPRTAYPGASTLASDRNIGDLGCVGAFAGGPDITSTLVAVPRCQETSSNLLAATASLPIIIARRAFLAEDFAVRTNFSAKLRRTPFRWRFLPYVSPWTAGASDVPGLSFFEMYFGGSWTYPGTSGASSLYDYAAT